MIHAVAGRLCKYENSLSSDPTYVVTHVYKSHRVNAPASQVRIRDINNEGEKSKKPLVLRLLGGVKKVVKRSDGSYRENTKALRGLTSLEAQTLVREIASRKQ